MDSAVTLALIAAGSPIAFAVTGFWIRRSLERSGNERTDRLAALALQNLDLAGAIETKVDGRLSKAVEDLASQSAAVTKLAVAFTDLQAKADRFQSTGTGGQALKDAIALPVPTPEDKKS